MSSLVPVAADGIIVPVGSSKRARRRRRQAAHATHFKRLSRAGRVPQHTRAERRRAAAERARQREADQRREKLIGRVMPPLAMGVAIPAFVFLGLSEPAVTGAHHWYPISSAAPFGGVGLPAGPDMPDLPEPGMTYYTPMITAGTAVTTYQRSIGSTYPTAVPGSLLSFGILRAEHLWGLTASGVFYARNPCCL